MGYKGKPNRAQKDEYILKMKRAESLENVSAFKLNKDKNSAYYGTVNNGERITIRISTHANTSIEHAKPNYNFGIKSRNKMYDLIEFMGKNHVRELPAVLEILEKEAYRQ